MIYSLTDIVWLFFLYSFLGWCVEVCWAAIHRKQFVNRGFVNSPSSCRNWHPARSSCFWAGC